MHVHHIVSYRILLGHHTVLCRIMADDLCILPVLLLFVILFRLLESVASGGKESVGRGPND